MTVRNCYDRMAIYMPEGSKRYPRAQAFRLLAALDRKRGSARAAHAIIALMAQGVFP